MASTAGNDLVLLSLDGGGVRGLASLLILKRIMYVLDEKIGPEVQRPLRPCDYFSMIAGTSTGGLIAIMLGVLRLDVDSCISHYLELAPKIFPKEGFVSGSKIAKLLKGAAGKARFDADILKEKVKEIIPQGPAKLKPDALLDEGSQGRESCQTRFVCVTNKQTSTPFRLRNYRSNWEPSTGCKIWEAVRATSAAPLYFPPISLGHPPTAYVDGGLLYNNPVRALYEEAQNVWGKSSRKIKCIISIGTGVPPLKATGDSGREILENLVDIAVNTQKVADEFAAEIDHLPTTNKIRYIRLNVAQGLQDMKLEEWKSFDLLTGATNYYLNTHRRDIDLCVDALTEAEIEPDLEMLGTSRLVSGLPLTSHEFFGRTAELEHIHQALRPSLSRQKRLVLWGFAGHGKSRLLQHYIHLHQIEFRSIIWVNASTLDNAEESMSQASSEIRNRNPAWASIAAADRKNSIKLVQRWLSQSRNPHWLLVLDGLDDLEAYDCRMLLPRCAHGSIAVTSTNSQAARILGFEGLEVDTMTIDDGSRMLLAGAQIVTSIGQSTAKRIVKELHGLPVAIEQARAILIKGIKLEEFIELYESRYDEVMSLKLVPSDTDYEKNLTVVRMLDLVCLRLKDDRDALNLLALESCMGSGTRPSYFTAIAVHKDDDTSDLHRLMEASGLPQAQWLTKFRRDILRSRLAMSKLEEHCVFKLKTDAAGVPIELSMHDSLRRWQFRKLTAEEKQIWSILAYSVMGEKLNQSLHQNNNSLSHLGFNQIPPIMHCQTLIEDSIERTELEYPHGRFCHFYGYLAAPVGQLFLEYGFLKQAELLISAAINYQRSVQGQNWPQGRESLLFMQRLFQTWKRAGKIAEASEMLHQLFQSSMEIAGESDNLTLWSAGQLRDLQESKIARSNDQYRALTRFSSPQNKAPEAAHNAMPPSTEAPGEIDQSTELSVVALVEDYLDALGLLSDTTENSDQANTRLEAIKLTDQDLERLEPLLTEYNSDMPWSVRSLGFEYSREERYDKALRMYGKAIGLHKNESGEYAPFTLSMLLTFSHCLLHVEVIERCVKFLEQIVKICKCKLGEDDILTLRNSSFLAALYHQVNRDSEARSLIERVVEKQKSTPEVPSGQVMYSKLVLERVLSSQASRSLPSSSSAQNSNTQTTISVKSFLRGRRWAKERIE